MPKKALRSQTLNISLSSIPILKRAIFLLIFRCAVIRLNALLELKVAGAILILINTSRQSAQSITILIFYLIKLKGYWINIVKEIVN